MVYMYCLSLKSIIAAHQNITTQAEVPNGSKYVQTVPDGSCLCPDFRAFARLSCVHVQTFVRSPDFRAFMSRLSCVHQTFVRSCPDFHAFTRLSCVQPIFVRSCPDFRAFYRLSCVHVQTFVRSPNFRAFNRFLCVHVQTFVRSPNFCAFNQFFASNSCLAFSRSSLARLAFSRSSLARLAFSRSSLTLSRFGLLVWVYDVCLWCMIYVYVAFSFLEWVSKKSLIKKVLLEVYFILNTDR